MNGWAIVVIALMVILTVAFVAYPLYFTASPEARNDQEEKRGQPSALEGQEAGRKPEADEAWEKALEEEIERQVRALRRKK